MLLSNMLTIRGRLGLNIALTFVGLLAIAGSVLWMVRVQILQDRRDKVHSIVEMAAGVMNELEKQVQAGKLTRNQALAQFAAVNEGLRYDGGNYVAVYDMQGTVRAFPGSPNLVGVNRIDLTDPYGVKIVRAALEIATQSGEGYYEYHYPKPGDTKDPAAKLSFVKGFAPWGLYLISGIYIDDVDATVMHFALMFGGIALPLILIIGGFTLSLRSSIGSGLARLSESLRKISAGDLDTVVQGSGRPDEIGAMAEAIEILKASAAVKRRLESETVENRAIAERERMQHEQQRIGDVRLQQEVVQALAEGLERLSKGDLLFRLEDQFAPEYEKLRSDFNGAMKKLQETIKNVAVNTLAIRSGSAEISTAADDLSRRTEQQAASLEETAAALDEITATVKKTSDGSIHARNVVASAKTDAEHSGAVVSQAVEAMSAIEQSAHQISQIIGVIDEIAFQTNLLALNAGVEAARAGEAGRGFAVVASEVRALAQRSAEAAKEIKALISTSSQQVGAGVELVNETGDALKRIVTQVAEINEVVSAIATSTQEQATALQEVNTAINQMDQVMQQNAAMVEESTAASKNLAQETEELARLITQFEVDANLGALPARSSRSKSKPAVAAVAAVTSMARGGAARKLEPVESWEEF